MKATPLKQQHENTLGDRCYVVVGVHISQPSSLLAKWDFLMNLRGKELREVVEVGKDKQELGEAGSSVVVKWQSNKSCLTN